MATRGARAAPTTRAPSSSKMASSPTRSPLTAPRTPSRRPLTPPPTIPWSAMVTSPVTTISPSTKPCTSMSPGPWTRPRTRVDLPMTVTLDAMGSHVHVDVALELGAVGDRHARGLHVADDARAPLHVGFHGGAVLDRHGILGRELAPHRPGDDDVLVRRDLALDGDA